MIMKWILENTKFENFLTEAVFVEKKSMLLETYFSGELVNTPK